MGKKRVKNHQLAWSSLPSSAYGTLELIHLFLIRPQFPQQPQRLFRLAFVNPAHGKTDVNQYVSADLRFGRVEHSDIDVAPYAADIDFDDSVCFIHNLDDLSR